MTLTPRLEVRQSQTLVITPQLQQAIKLLQLSNLELSTFVEQELERNPLLERTDGQPEAGGDNAPFGEMNGDANGHDLGADHGVAETLKLDGDGAAASAEGSFDAEVNNEFTNDSASDMPPDLAAAGLGGSYSKTGGSASFDDDDHNLENTLTRGATLHEHLTEQLLVESGDQVERAVGAAMIDMIDDSGYLREPLEEIAERLGCDLERVESTLILIQGFDPTGVGARDLAECLALQLRERNRLDPAMAAMLERLDLVAKRDIQQLTRHCGVDAEDIADMMRELRTLNPKPGAEFDSDDAKTVVPDVLVRRLPDGSWHVELNAETLPRVLVKQRYHAKVSGATRNKADKTYLSDCLSSANWLVKSLDQRANTILKVASEIVRQQDLFLEKGVQYLKPLNLRVIAEAIGMHESTVSRVTANKYIATPRGIFELKYFFTASIAATNGGEAHSAEAVRQRIRELIEKETQETVLSDDKLVEILVASGIDIARRTVAKYRESLRIPSSVQRRRMLQSGWSGGENRAQSTG
jgi:RNA polymerase sigma-54 factor